jgi:phosphoribosylaminoimidazolecarboxamide formyltransferase/IMP cyclohydrolase
MKKAALISVSDRTGLEEFAKTLKRKGYTILATTGSKRFLDEAHIETVSIESYTGQREILDGRVKTLHPMIHAGILAKRDNADHIREITNEGILAIDIVVVNLYPFLDQVKKLAAVADSKEREKKLIEFIDIGGPTMIRAAAKNFSGVLAIIDPGDYERTAAELNSPEGVSHKLRRELATKVFSYMSYYDLAVARALSQTDEKEFHFLSVIEGVVLEEVQPLRYGENPAQQAAFYKSRGEKHLPWKQCHGKELSYNNLLDVDAVRRIIATFCDSEPTAVIVKHGNPCGIASAGKTHTALSKAKQCDPRSHFGGVIAFNRTVDLATAELIGEDFVEIVVAPSFAKDAFEHLTAKKALRLLEVTLEPDHDLEIRKVFGGYLMQVPDVEISPAREALVVSKRHPTAQELSDAEHAWKICAHVKSNAITIVKDSMLIGVGAGQMSRIDSVELALSKAKLHGHLLKDAVAASDAFFPFPDSLETFAKDGVSCVIAPGGSKRDNEVIAVADRLGIALLFASERHFRH